ncbi:MAG TPA: AAA domain-containing protein [Ktedonobacterales bacterium]
MGTFGRVGRARTTAAPDELAPGEVLAAAPARAGLTPVGEWPDVSARDAAKRKDDAPTSAAFAGVCRYFHDCFAADARGGVLTNVLDKHQAEYLTFADSVEVLLTGQIDRLEVNLSTGVTAQNAADVNRREKFLIYGSIFLVGRGRASGKSRGELYCAPLLYWPAHIEQEGSQAFMSVDLEEQRINFPLLASLIDAENDEQAQAYAEVILGQVPAAPFDNQTLREFASVVGELIPELRTDDLEAYPQLQNQQALEELLDSPVQLLCASAMALVRRPTEARGVLTELQEMGNRGAYSTPLSAIFGDAAVLGKGAPPPRDPAQRPILSGAELSQAQTRVLRRAEQRPLTLVIGPPGTGKSFTIAQLILDAVARGQTVLLSSKMNKAVDVVVEKLMPHLGNLTIILRGGDRRYRDELKQFLDNLFDGTGAPPKPRPGEIEMLEERLGAADAEIERLDGEIERLLGAETEWSRTAERLARLGPATYNEEAAAALGADELRQADSEMRRLAAQHLPLLGWLAHRKRQRIARELGAKLGIPAARLREMPRIAEREATRADLADTDAELAGHDELNALLTRHARLRADRGALVGELLATRRRDALADALRLNRRTLALFKTALEARSTAEQDKIFAELDFAALLRTFPIWAVTNPHAAELLPLGREMFDLVVIDEASQCDVASALPLLFRAKRAIVCGDPKQLRHLSFLREDRQAALASQHGLTASQRSQWNYRTHSLLDVVNGALPSQDDVVLLDEHYRSLPQIIEFSNQRFYGEALRVMTRRPDTIGVRSLELRKVNGKRRKEGYNVEEVEAIIKEIEKIAKAEAKKDPRAKSSIGVLSPFRDQVNYLTRTLASRLKPRVIQDHDIIFGTAHTFQGDERDVMLLSFCADPTSHRSSLTFMNQENLFNVAVTRARRRQVIFTALDPRNLPPNHLLTEYLTYAADCLEPEKPEDHGAAATSFERAVGQALGASPDYTVYLGYPVAGFTVDVVAQRGARALAIACDGDPERQPPLPGVATLDTPTGQAILERAGWRVHRVPYRRWLGEREACLGEIDALLGGESTPAEEAVAGE